jgi:hypothetical protein
MRGCRSQKKNCGVPKGRVSESWLSDGNFDTQCACCSGGLSEFVAQGGASAAHGELRSGALGSASRPLRRAAPGSPSFCDETTGLPSGESERGADYTYSCACVLRFPNPSCAGLPEAPSRDLQSRKGSS